MSNNQNFNKLRQIGKKLPHKTFVLYQNKNAMSEVIGCLMNDPQLLRTYKVEQYDAVDVFQQILLGAIKNIAREGAGKIEVDTVSDYLKTRYQSKWETFKAHNGQEYLQKARDLSLMSNFKRNYDEVKKWSLLRSLINSGMDVSDYFDPDILEDPEEAEKRAEKFEESTLEDIISDFKGRLVSIDAAFNNFSDRESIRAGGEEAMAQKEAWKEQIKHGLAYCSNYLTTVTYGIQKGKFSVSSAGSGVGKTRLSVANMGHTFAPKFWDRETGKWIDNPNGTKNSCLYIGTEMKLREEVEPILWAYMADVPEDHILLNRYEKGEEERVDEAIKILSEHENDCGIYMEFIPNYDIATLEEIIRYHVKHHHVTAVFLDYIHSTTALVAEYQRSTGGKMAIREDQVLGNLSLKLKDFTNEFNISLDTWTQVTGDFKNEKNRDQTIVRGAKAIIDKTDWAAIVSRPTTSELDKLQKILRNKVVNAKNRPNICFSVYKNRGGRYNEIKIWLYVDYGTMRVHDLFVTGYDYLILPIKKTTVELNEDGNPIPIEYEDNYKSFLERLSKESKEYDKKHPNDFPDVDDVAYGDSIEKIEERIRQHELSTVGSSLIDEIEREDRLALIEQGPAYEGNPYFDLDKMDDLDYDE